VRGPYLYTFRDLPFLSAVHEFVLLMQEGRYNSRSTVPTGASNFFFFSQVQSAGRRTLLLLCAHRKRNRDRFISPSYIRTNSFFAVDRLSISQTLTPSPPTTCVPLATGKNEMVMQIDVSWTSTGCYFCTGRLTVL